MLGFRKQSPAQERMKFLFLESHGLRTPITAIRWACGRLRKIGAGKFAPDELRLVDQIQLHAKKLSSALESLLLLAKVEDGSQPRETQDICLPSLLSAVGEKVDLGDGVRWNVRSEHIHLKAEREILELILRDIGTVFQESPEDVKDVSLDVVREPKGVAIAFQSSWSLPLLQDMGDGRRDAKLIQRVGGIPGLMLSLSQALAEHVPATVDLEEVITGEFISDGTVELAPGSSDEHRIVVTIPVKTTIVEGSCSRRQ